MKKNLLLIILALQTIAVTTSAQQYVNPLDRWARYNVDELNTFATGDEDMTRGQFYQFGRNVAMASDGDVLYWANQGGPYENGSPANYRVWHIHLLNTFSGDGNWFGTGTTEDTWESIVSQTVANGAPPTGTFDGYDYTVEGYVGVNGGSPAPVGWHIPTYAEMKSLIPVVGSNDFAYETFTVNDFQETSVDILGDGNPQNYVSDFKSVDLFTVVALRFKGTPHETAFRYEYQDIDGFNTLEIRARPSNGATIDQIASWSLYDWQNADDVVVRYFPSTGFRSSGSGKLNSDTEGYYWTGAVSDTGKAYYFTFSSKRLRGSSYNRSNAFAIRCVKDYDNTVGIVQKKAENNIFIKQDNGVLSVYGTDLEGKLVTVYNASGSTVYAHPAAGSNLMIDLPKGVYIVNVDGKNTKVIAK